MLSGNSTDAYLEWHYRLISSIVWVPLTLIGVCGNLMVILVVMTVRGMKTPTNCYLVSLAVADCLFFLSSTPVEFASIHLPEDVFLFGRVGCSILRFLPFLSMNASSLSITAFTVERYIGICHPMKARYICTVKRAQMIIVIIWSCSILYNSTWLFLTDIKPLNYTDWPNAYQCTYSLNRASYKAVFILDLFAFYWIPLALYLILYGSMARILVKAGFFDSSTSAPSSTVGTPATKRSAASQSAANGRESSLGPIGRVRFPSLRKSQSSTSAASTSNAAAAVRLNSRTSAKMSSTSSGGGRQRIGGGGGPRSPLLISTAASRTDVQLLNGRRVGSATPRACGSNNSALNEDDATVFTLTVGGYGGSRTNPPRSRSPQRTEKTSPSLESKAYYGEGLNKARVQVVKMLVVIVVMFALFWLPYRGLVVYNSFTQKPWIEKWYLLFAKTMVMVNCAINPILYNVMSGKFRSAFILMFKRCVGHGSRRPRHQSDHPSMVIGRGNDSVTCSPMVTASTRRTPNMTPNLALRNLRRHQPLSSSITSHSPECVAQIDHRSPLPSIASVPPPKLNRPKTELLLPKVDGASRNDEENEDSALSDPSR